MAHKNGLIFLWRCQQACVDHTEWVSLQVIEWNCLHNYFTWIEIQQPSLGSGNGPLLKPYGSILRRDEAMLAPGHFPWTFWVRSSWKESCLYVSVDFSSTAPQTLSAAAIRCFLGFPQMPLWSLGWNQVPLRRSWLGRSSLVPLGINVWIIIWAKGFCSQKKRKITINSVKCDLSTLETQLEGVCLFFPSKAVFFKLPNTVTF